MGGPFALEKLGIHSHLKCSKLQEPKWNFSPVQTWAGWADTVSASSPALASRTKGPVRQSSPGDDDSIGTIESTTAPDPMSRSTRRSRLMSLTERSLLQILTILISGSDVWQNCPIFRNTRVIPSTDFTSLLWRQCRNFYDLGPVQQKPKANGRSPRPGSG